MQPAAICFSVMVRPNDSQTGHSVTQLAVRGGGLSGAKKPALENTAREGVMSSKHNKTYLTASERSLVESFKHLIMTEEEGALC